MDLRIFTLPFDETSESFPDEIITQFCLNKKVHRLDSQFFLQDGRPFWSVAVHYEVILKGKEPLRELDEEQKKLFERIRQWRKERADKEGIPAYLICTNAQLVHIIRLKCQTLETFKQVRGFGKKRISKYGKAMIEMIKAFYETKKAAEEKEAFPF